MNARIVCFNLSEDIIIEGLELGDYDKNDPSISSIGYKMYGKEDVIIIELENAFDFCQMSFVLLDIIEVSRDLNREVMGFVDTDRNNKITEYLDGERICFYLSDELDAGLKENEDNYLDVLDIVTQSNKNYSISIDNFFSYQSENNRNYLEPGLDLSGFELLAEGVFLYEEGDFENEYLEDLEDEN